MSSPVFLNTSSELKPYYISSATDYLEIRKREQNEAFTALRKEHFVFIESGIGAGLYGFIHSVVVKYKPQKNFFKVNFSDVIVKNQIDDCFIAYTGVNPQLLIFEMNKETDVPYIIIIDNIRGDIDGEALNYLVQIVNVSRVRNDNIYFIFASTVTFPQFTRNTVKINNLTFDETSLVLRKKFHSSKLANIDIVELHDLSEGVVVKLEKIISSLLYSSPNEVLTEKNLFDDIYQSDDVPSHYISQIDFIAERPDKSLTFIMLKILAILKNGESLTNLRKDKLGQDLTIKNSREIIQLGLASVIEIDTSTTLIKLNPIIKDYVLSLLTENDIFTISSAYLKIVVTETKKGIRVGANNRKIIDKGYNTEEDNAVVLLRNSILECKHHLGAGSDLSEQDHYFYTKRLNRLSYLSLSYVYSLDNSCRYKESVFAASNLLQVVEGIDDAIDYKLYYHLGSCQRMLSLKEEALDNLQKAKKLCPINEKSMLERIYVEELYILDETDSDEAVSVAKRSRKNYKANSIGHINSEYITSSELPKGARIEKLEFLEKKSRRNGFHTLANNILFTINTIKEDADSISILNKVMDTDSNSYNYCKAMIFKYEILVGNSEFSKISDRDFHQLFNIFNYMFKQGLNSLLDRCHDLLWKIAEYKRNNNIIIVIYFKSAISWQLNNNLQRLEKYNALFDAIEQVPDVEP